MKVFEVVTKPLKGYFSVPDAVACLGTWVHVLQSHNTGSAINWPAYVDQLGSLIEDGIDAGAIVLRLPPLFAPIFVNKTQSRSNIYTHPKAVIRLSEAYEWLRKHLPADSDMNPMYALDHPELVIPDSYKKPTIAPSKIAKEAQLYPWIGTAQRLGLEIVKRNKAITVERISEKVRAEMEDLYKLGDQTVLGRGGKLPSAESIRRHALTGIKQKAMK